MKFDLSRLQELTGEQADAEALRSKRAERERNIGGFRGIGDCLTAPDVAAVVANELKRTKLLVDVRAWSAQSERPILLLASLPGRGKTLACAWWLANRGGYYVACEDFLRLSAARFGDDADRFERIRNFGNVVLDDAGREAESDVERMRAALLELVDRRRSGRKRTIITTNLSQAAFTQRYADERLASRLAQSAVWRTDAAGADLRRAK